MASTNKTVNYELSQFEGSDKPSWEADYNADMLAIDTNLKAVSDVADGASGDITTLDGRMDTAEGNITTNANDIDALEARADALEAGQTSDDSRLDALEAEQIVQNTAIESNTRLGYNLARPYDSASTYAVGAYVLFQDTLYKCTTAVTTGESFDPNKWLAIKATDEIAAGGVTANEITSDVISISGIDPISGTTVSDITIQRPRLINLQNMHMLNFTLFFTYNGASTNNVNFIINNWYNTPKPKNDGVNRTLYDLTCRYYGDGVQFNNIQGATLALNASGASGSFDSILLIMRNITPNTNVYFRVDVSLIYIDNN